MMRSILLLALLVSGSTSCSASYVLERNEQFAEPPKLDPDGTMFVSVPADGQFGEKHYEGSGEATADTVVAAFSRKLPRVERASAPATYEASLARAAEGSYRYFLQPTILHWEDRATEWSGKSDRVEVRLILVEVAGGEVLDNVTIQGKSKWMTFGGDHPQELLAEPLDDYADSLF